MKYLIFALLLLATASAIGATISETPTAPQPLQSTDKVPMGRQGTSTAYTATMGQISDYVKAQPGTTANTVDTASKRFTSDSEKAAWNAKQAPLSNAVTLGKIGESNGAPTWNGVAWPGGGEGGTAYFNGRPSPIFPQAGDYTAAQVGADPVGTAAANMSAHTSSYDHANIPNAGQKAALAGSSGAPGIGNKYVTDTDARLTNSRAPNAHATSHGAGASDPVTLSTSQVTGLDTALAGKQTTLGNAATLGKISEGGNLPLWNGGTWPGGAGSGDMYKATYDPQGKQVDAFDRANHTGTQPVGTITGLAPSATTNTTTTANITDSTDKRFVTDAQRTVLGNTSGTNSGNVTLGTTNGLSLSGQQLSLQAATNAQPGALTAADHTTYSNAASLAATALQPAGNGSALTGLTKTQVGLANVDNTSDTNKPVSTAQQAALDLKAPKDNPTFTTGITTPAIIPSSPDGTWRMNVRNSVTRTYTPQEGDMDTDAAGRIWLYVTVNGTPQWVEKGAAYTLPTAGPSSLGGVKVGTGLAVDGSGVMSVTSTGITVRAPFSGAQSVSVGNAYTTSAAATLTLSGHAAGTMSVKAKALTRIVPDSAGSYFTWSNPITDAVNSASAGWSIDIPAGTYAVIDSDGTGAFQVKLTTKNLQTGVNEYASPVPVASVAPSSINFGSVAAGSTSSASSTVLTNAGTANLTTGTPTISGTDAARFAISANGCNAATVTPGNSCTESVTFTPTAAASYSAQLNLPHNAAGSPTVVALTGTGTSSGGTPAWQYSTITDTNDVFDTTSAYYTAAPVTIGASTAITGLAFKPAVVGAGGMTCKLALYDTATPSNLLANGTCSPVAGSWCSTPITYTGSATATYRVAISCNNGIGFYGVTGASTGIYAGGTYAAFPTATQSWDSIYFDKLISTAICTGGTCGGLR